MFETPSSPAHVDIDSETFQAELRQHLEDPIAAVVGVEVSRRFVGYCLSWAEPMVADLAAQESLLRQAGGPGLTERILAQRFYRRIEPHVLRMLEACVALEHSEAAFTGLEQALRARFADVVRTATSYLLSHDRDCAIQMVAVSATMAAREIRAEVSEILTAARPIVGDTGAPDATH